MLLLECSFRFTFDYTAIFCCVQSQYGFRFVQIGPAGIGLFGRYQCWIYVTTACAPISYCPLWHRHSGTVCWPCGEFKKWQTASVYYCFFFLFGNIKDDDKNPVEKTSSFLMVLLWLVGGFGLVIRLIYDECE